MKELRFAVVAALTAAACNCNKSEPTAASAAPSGQPAPSTAPLAAGNVAPSAWLVAAGPRLAVLPGMGVGPIRFGATVETIERLMGVPCEIRTDDACRYIARAIEFKLKDGAAVEMHIHRRDRQAMPDGRTYGIFNGRMQEGVAFFMLPSGVHELIGKPRKVEPVKDPGPWNMVEVHDYPGMRLEFDRIENGNTVLGGFILAKAETK